MKDSKSISARIRYLLVQELDRRVQEASQRVPVLCRHNYRHSLDTRKEVMSEPNIYYNRIADEEGNPVGQTLGLCLLGSGDPEKWNGTICEDDIDAKRCPYFTPLRSKAVVWEEFQRDTSDPEWVAANMGPVHELLWVLEEDSCPSLPWWKRLWYRWFLRIVVAPPLQVGDPLLLPPAPLSEETGDDDAGDSV